MTIEPVTLFTRAGCPLCDEAKEALRGLLVTWTEVDVDADADLVRRYGERVPVIERDGRVLFEGNLNETPTPLADLLRS